MENLPAKAIEGSKGDRLGDGGAIFLDGGGLSGLSRRRLHAVESCVTEASWVHLAHVPVPRDVTAHGLVLSAVLYLLLSWSREARG